MITQKLYKSLIRSIGTITWHAEDTKKRFAILGIDDDETLKAFKQIKKIEKFLKAKVKDLGVESADDALESWFGKERLDG